MPGRGTVIFTNRCAAGRQLAALLEPYRAENPAVLGLPRGGVAVAFEIAHALEAPLDVLVVRKIGAPGHPELAIGAVAPNATVVNERAVAVLRVSDEYLEHATNHEYAIVAARLRRYRADRPDVPLRDRAAIVVDDGIATGATVLAAVRSARHEGARRVIAAAPVASAEAVAKLRDEADAVVCVQIPDDLYAISLYYEDFTQLTDPEVTELLKRARLEREAHFHPAETRP